MRRVGFDGSGGDRKRCALGLNNYNCGWTQTVARWNTSLRRFSVLDVIFDTLEAFVQAQDGQCCRVAGVLCAAGSVSVAAGVDCIVVRDSFRGELVRDRDTPGRDYLPGSDSEVLQILEQVVALRGQATVFGVVALLWTASGVFDVLQYALNRAWQVPQPPAFWIQRLLSIGVIGILGRALFLISVLAAGFSDSFVVGIDGWDETAREVRGCSVMG